MAGARNSRTAGKHRQQQDLFKGRHMMVNLTGRSSTRHNELQAAHRHWWVVASAIAIISPTVLAESKKTDSKSFKPFECDGKELVSLAQNVEHLVFNGVPFNSTLKSKENIRD
jgi:hypothetical protein